MPLDLRFVSTTAIPVCKLDDIINGLKLHHTSLCRGYVNAGVAMVEKYDGKFGKGFRVFTRNKESTTYCIATYYLEGGHENAD